jgi:L-ascorbate metabolism protein UlaG (beta-lactamase superfamily)
VLFAGAARTALFDGAPLTLTSANAAEAAKVLGAAKVVPLHFRGWQHFSEGPDALRKEFEAAGLTDRLVLLEPGERAEI